jgi:hypothetical protein
VRPSVGYASGRYHFEFGFKPHENRLPKRILMSTLHIITVEFADYDSSVTTFTSGIANILAASKIIHRIDKLYVIETPIFIRKE